MEAILLRTVCEETEPIEGSKIGVLSDIAVRVLSLNTKFCFFADQTQISETLLRLTCEWQFGADYYETGR